MSHSRNRIENHNYNEIVNINSVRHPNRALKRLLILVLILMVAHTLSGLIYLLWPKELTHKIYIFFNVGTDRNLPTYFSGILWLIAGALCWKLYSFDRKDSTIKRGWRMLVAVSFYISFDELLMVHEHLTNPVRNLLNNPATFGLRGLYLTVF